MLVRMVVTNIEHLCMSFRINDFQDLYAFLSAVTNMLTNEILGNIAIVTLFDVTNTHPYYCPKVLILLILYALLPYPCHSPLYTYTW